MATPVRLVLDTNVVISALLWRGAPYELLTFVRQHANLQLWCSRRLLIELGSVLARPALLKRLAAIGREPADVLMDYASAVHIIRAPALPRQVSRDPDDDAVLALAIAAGADWIVSGDQDLLVLRQFEGIPILSAGDALARLTNSVP